MPIRKPASEPLHSTELKKTDYSVKINELKASLETSLLKRVNLLENVSGKTTEDKIASYIALGNVWDSLGKASVSAYYFRLIAENKPAEKSYLNAAYRYFDAFKQSKSAGEKAEMSANAIECYSKVLGFNPKNLNAKCDLGILYAESSPSPMKGILLLKEVVAENPEHENAQFSLGILSMKSNQTAKAVERFEKVIEINPKNTDAYLMLSNVYLQSGNKEKAIQSLSRLQSVIKEPALSKEIADYILKIRNNSNN